MKDGSAKVAPVDKNYPPHGLEAGVQHEPEWIRLGCGNEQYICEEKGATFDGINMPDKLPDLSEHNNLMAQGLRENPQWYAQLKDKKTSKGVTLGQCIKPGIDQKGHPNITICGLAAGDEECWEVFKPVFDYVLEKRHGHGPDDKHPTDMNIDNVSNTKIDPTGNYVLTSRCRTARSVKNFRLPPCNSFEERRKLEALITEGLLSLDGELKGDYYPLPGSRSYAPKMGGMSKEYAEKLRNRGNLFQCPDSPLLLSSGCGRHWPDARGIFHNDAMNFFVWIGEEDHMRIISMEEGDNIKNIFRRFCNATQAIQTVLKKNGHDFMHNEHLGFIAACPSNVGTGLRGGSMMKIPLFSSRPDFKKTCVKMGLQVRGSRGVDSGAGSGGIYDISNAARIGKSETDLLNIYFEGVANILRWEGMLEQGKSIDREIARVRPGTPIA